MKKMVTFTIDENILSNFNLFSKENAINKSVWVENKIKELLEEAENEKEFKFDRRKIRETNGN